MKEIIKAKIRVAITAFPQLPRRALRAILLNSMFVFIVNNVFSIDKDTIFSQFCVCKIYCAMTLIIVLVILAVLVIWVIGVQNRLVKIDELCNNALKQINVQQISRFDALKALIKLTREYASFEAETLEKVVKERKIVSSPNPSTADINANKEALSAIGAKLIAVAEAYPDLKASANYQQTMKDIKDYEENVRLSRMTYNDTVTRFNQQVRMFPTSLVAGILGFSKRDYLAEDVSKKDYPEI